MIFPARSRPDSVLAHPEPFIFLPGAAESDSEKERKKYSQLKRRKKQPGKDRARHPNSNYPFSPLLAITPRMNFKFAPMSFSTDRVGLSHSSCAHLSKPMSASASTTAVKSIFPWPRKFGLSFR